MQTWVLQRLVFKLWPTRSPDLNQLDFYLQGHLKSIVYAMAVYGVAELQERVDDKAICNSLQFFSACDNP
jgi:hypothetical protein